jgi:hypothetical protein
VAELSLEPDLADVNMRRPVRLALANADFDYPRADGPAQIEGERRLVSARPAALGEDEGLGVPDG